MLDKSVAFVTEFAYVYIVCYLQKQGQAPFDASAVDNMRRLLEHSSVPGHIYPLSLLCYEIMPPPQQVCLVVATCSLVDFLLLEPPLSLFRFKLNRLRKRLVSEG